MRAYATRKNYHFNATLKPFLISVEIPGVSFHDGLFKAHQIRHAAVYRRPTSVYEIKEMVSNAITFTTLLEDALLTRRIELIRKEVGEIIEELKPIQNGLERRISEELAEIAHSRRSLDRCEEKAVNLMLSKGNRNRLHLGLRLDELLISHQKCTGSDFHSPEEMSCAEVNDGALK